MIKKIVLALCFLGVIGSAEAKIIDFESFKIDNGLEVVVISNHKAPVSLIKLYYKVGAVDEPYFKGGMAHLLEHLMFRGTKKVKDKEFNHLTEVNGVQNNAYTTFAHTGYYEFSDISKLELMMALEADRMTNLEISDEVFETERGVVLEERLQRFETNVATKFYETIEKIFWDKHPYARPISGEVEVIKGLLKKDIIEFYEKYYQPSNAILVLAGDIKLEEAKVLVDKYFGKIKNKNLIERKKIEEPKEEKVYFGMKLNEILQKRFVGYWHLPIGSLKRDEKMALNFLSKYLGGGDTDYLYDELVYKGNQFLSVDMGYKYDEKLGGYIFFSGVPVDEKMKLEEFEEILNEYMKRGIDEVDENKVEKIKNRILSGSVYLIEEPRGMANFVGEAKLQDYSDDEIKNLDDEIKKVRVKDVVEIFQKIFNQKVKKVYGELDKI